MSRTCQKISNRRGLTNYLICALSCVHQSQAFAKHSLSCVIVRKSSQQTVRLHHTIRLICISTEGLRFEDDCLRSSTHSTEYKRIVANGIQHIEANCCEGKLRQTDPCESLRCKYTDVYRKFEKKKSIVIRRYEKKERNKC